MLQTRQLIVIALVAVPGVSAITQEPPRDPGAIVLLASSEGHTADVELRQALTDPQTLVLPLHNTYVQCDTQPAGRTVPVQDLDPDKVVQPKLKREVKPDYSRAAMDHRIEGVVELTAQVTENGCVASAEVLSGLPYLDVQALLAVTQWRFEPAQFEGAGVPTRVGIELTFKLK